MEFRTFIFYFFAAILVLSALRVITARNPVHAVLFLVLAFFSCSGLWVLLEAEFLAITLVLVYVGAVMVLFLFVVMMLDINIERLRKGFWKTLPLGLMVAGLMIAEIVVVVSRKYFDTAAPTGHPVGHSNIKDLGSVLYTDYLYAFEIAAVILLVAIIAAIALTLRHRKDTKYQNPAQQVSVKREDRIRIVSIPSEKKNA